MSKRDKQIDDAIQKLAKIIINAERAIQILEMGELNRASLFSDELPRRGIEARDAVRKMLDPKYVKYYDDYDRHFYGRTY